MVARSKSYRLEDLEKSKIITSRDVNFQEDNRPSDLSQVKTGLTWSEPEEIDKFVDNTVYSDNNTPCHEPAITSYEHKDKNINMELDDEDILENDLLYPSRPTIPENTTVISSYIALQKMSKWDDLSKHNSSIQEWHVPAQFWQNEGDLTHHIAYITVNGPPVDKAFKTPQTNK